MIMMIMMTMMMMMMMMVSNAIEILIEIVSDLVVRGQHRSAAPAKSAGFQKVTRHLS